MRVKRSNEVTHIERTIVVSPKVLDVSPPTDNECVRVCTIQLGKGGLLGELRSLMQVRYSLVMAIMELPCISAAPSLSQR